MPLHELADLAAHLGVAALLGGLLGLEREMNGRPAGLRTHLLVSLGAATFALLSPVMAAMSPHGPADAGRIAAQVVTGVGFLGAGAILKEGLTIRGLTTAASLWIAAAIGTSAGAGQYAVSALTTAFALLTLFVLPWLEATLPRRSRHLLRVTTARGPSVGKIIDALQAAGLRVVRCDQDHDVDAGVMTLQLTVRIFHPELAHVPAGAALAALDAAGVAPLKVSWRSL